MRFCQRRPAGSAVLPERAREGGGGRGGPQAHFVVLWVLVVAFLQCGRMHPSDVPLLVAVAGVHEPNIVRHFALPQAQPYVPPRAREVVY